MPNLRWPITKTLQHEWTLLQSVNPNCSHSFSSTEAAISECFLPALFGQGSTDLEHLQYSLPTRMGGLGIKNPTLTADSFCNDSRKATIHLTQAVKGIYSFSPSDHEALIMQTRFDSGKVKQYSDDQLFSHIFDHSDHLFQRTLTHNKKSLSSWLNILPIPKDGFNLTANEF